MNDTGFNFLHLLLITFAVSILLSYALAKKLWDRGGLHRILGVICVLVAPGLQVLSVFYRPRSPDAENGLLVVAVSWGLGFHLLLVASILAMGARECGELARWGWRKLSRP